MNLEERRWKQSQKNEVIKSFGKREENEQRTLADLFRQTTPKEYCYFCQQGVPEEDHLHASFLNLIPRCEPIIDSSYALDGKFLEGYRLVMTVDTTRAEEQYCKLLVTSGSNEIVVRLRKNAENFVEFVKMPVISKGIVGQEMDFEFRVAVKVNNNDPEILNLSGNQSYTKFITVLSDSVLIITHWKKVPGLQLF